MIDYWKFSRVLSMGSTVGTVLMQLRVRVMARIPSWGVAV
jgi:hypothetical protein